SGTGVTAAFFPGVTVEGPGAGAEGDGVEPAVRYNQIIRPSPRPTPTAVAEYNSGISQCCFDGAFGGGSGLSCFAGAAAAGSAAAIRTSSAADCVRSAGSDRSSGEIRS